MGAKGKKSQKSEGTSRCEVDQSGSKKLEYIAHVEKTIPKEILNELINNAFNDAKSKSRQS